MNKPLETSPHLTQAPNDGIPCVSRRAITRECPNCGAEMARADILLKKAANDREEDSISTTWVCSADCGYKN